MRRSDGERTEIFGTIEDLTRYLDKLLTHVARPERGENRGARRRSRKRAPHPPPDTGARCSSSTGERAETREAGWAAATEGLRSAVEQLRAVEEELAATRAEAETERTRYRELFEFAPDGYLVTDAHGRISEANRAATAMFNLRPSYLANKPIVVFVDKPDRRRLFDAMSSMRTQSRGEWLLRMCPRDRPCIVAHVTIGAIRGWDGTLEGLRWMMRDVTDQQQAEADLVRHREQLRDLAAALARAEERERRRIATGIHDGVSQTLAIARMTLGAVEESASPGQLQAIRDVSALLGKAIDESRTLTFELSPPVLYELGLGPAVEWLGEQVQRRSGVGVEVRDRLGRAELPTDVRVLLFQTVRELLTNVAKHAGARSASVTLAAEPHGVRVDVADNGSGFDPKQFTPDQSGFGLFNVRNRIEQTGGRFRVRSKAGLGTRITIRLRYDGQQPAENARST